ncbi:type II secretion system F family protein [Siminovitchia sediminis]|uniref:Type II secretion system F family protein n=1 Tax=Siminovitchia sediminis TaxID=1274353 RepID=A0ABW4KKA1_9BACI
MMWFFAISMFLFLFFLLLALSSLFGRSSEKTESVQLKDVLKKGNYALKGMLVSNKKPSPKKDQTEEQLNSAGIPIKAEEFLAFRVFSVFIAGGLLYILSDRILFFGLGAVIGWMLPGIWLKLKKAKRIKKFNESLPGFISAVTGSLRAGFSFPQALKMAEEESLSPMKEELGIVLKAMQYGASVEEALVDWKTRMQSEELELMVEAILIQRQVGGNLAFLLDKISDTLRERKKLDNEVKTLTAQGRMSGVIISLLPIILGILIFFMNPDYISTLFSHPIGRTMLVMAVIGEIIGYLSIKKITRIEV